MQQFPVGGTPGIVTVGNGDGAAPWTSDPCSAVRSVTTTAPVSSVVFMFHVFLPVRSAGNQKRRPPGDDLFPSLFVLAARQACGPFLAPTATAPRGRHWVGWGDYIPSV